MIRIGSGNTAHTMAQGVTRRLSRSNSVSSVRSITSVQDVPHRRLSGHNIWQRITNMVNKTPDTAQLNHALNESQSYFGEQYGLVLEKFEQLMPGTFNNKEGKKALKKFEKKLSLVLDKINENKTISEFSWRAVSSILRHDTNKRIEAKQRIYNKYGNLKKSVIVALLDDSVKKKALNQILDFKYPGKLQDPNLENVRKKLVEYDIIPTGSTLHNPKICPPTPTPLPSRESSIPMLEPAGNSHNSDSFSLNASNLDSHRSNSSNSDSFSSSAGSYSTNSSLGGDNNRSSQMLSPEFRFNKSI